MINIDKKHIAVLLFALISNIGGASYALDDIKSKADKETAPSFSIDEAATLIRERKMGRILRAQRITHETGQEQFRFRVLNNKGVVQILEIDPQNPQSINRTK